MPTPYPHPSTPTTYTLNFTGDVMLARLIDQLFSTHLPSPHYANIIKTFIERYPYLSKYNHRSPWGSALALFRAGDLNLVNLETAVTEGAEKWPRKVFNYRMHPGNLGVLREGRVDFVSLANNHTVDFGEGGLRDTIRGVRGVGVGFAGVGNSAVEAKLPAVLRLPRDSDDDARGDEEKHTVHVYSASDHPRDWSVIPEFHLIDYTLSTKHHLKTLLTTPSHPQSKAEEPSLKIFSIHWGPNYTWQPSAQIRDMAHFLIDECGVDIVHGHSAHHIQGVEKYKGSVIMYGCGDFVDDYALNEEFRNDLGGVWRVVVSTDNGDGGGGKGKGKGKGLELDRLEMYPTRCDRFQVTLLDVDDEDHGWVRRKIMKLSEEMGTRVRRELGREGQVVVDLRD
ncbi:CapA family protein [Aspergillus glaucus CBS 516.65]|uniref:Capsule synthesis protein CapA domain-containing protein n=1 Tax=Aspergillus glaucus CBS 516.65 TaxID=1160497 RepID=A0A1L9V6I6_ASPGL|nr:hypothetical protein ASPGLDRAFT_52593 [Aspergillus glaucus CBS 516.65]OJJ79544.1 hypothetical protein ASPGLDRAFT_52593 [Aspergillus glaucus CBS 516.65]